MRATVLGSGGFIGGHMVRHLQGLGYDVAAPGRADLADLSGSLGHVFYCIGLTGNFRKQPLATVEAHAGLLAGLLQRIDFDSFLYFSSTRIYAGANSLKETAEDAPICVRPSADTTYDLSKMLGEALCLSLDGPQVRVLRLSNVYGAGQSSATFLGSVLRDLATTGKTVIGESADSAKDYICVDDVVTLAERIARSGGQRIYNVASGRPVSHGAIAQAAADAGYSCTFRPGGARRRFPAINITRITDEFAFAPRRLLDDLPALLRTA